MRGFFSEADTLRKPLPLLAECGRCKLYQTCQSPKMKPRGKGKRNVLVVGESPGKEADARGDPFAGAGGQALRSALARAGVDLDADCVSTYAVVCRPPKGDKAAQQRAVLFCRPNVLETIDRVRPTTILLVGQAAVKSVIGHTWKEEVGQIGTWAGWRVPDQTLNAWLCPVRSPDDLDKSDVLAKQFRSHVKAAVALDGRPWDAVPDWRKDIELVYQPDVLKSRLAQYIQNGKPVAIDYETDGLKPDRQDRTVVCFSVSDGYWTICYPWTKETEALTKDFLRSPVPKIASNMKFEERWTLAWAGKKVRNWWWDTMLASRVLDNRDGISSIKFQSYVRLGQPDYDSHLRKYLEAPSDAVARSGANAKNRIKEAPLDQLMVYCGMDSLLEWKVAHLQRKEMGYAQAR